MEFLFAWVHFHWVVESIKSFTTFFSWLQDLAKILLQGWPLFERGFVIPEKMDFLTEKQHFTSIKKVKYNIWEAKDVLSKTFWITFYLSTVSDSAVSSITHIKIQTKNQFIQSKSARYTRMLPSYFDYLGNWIAVVSDSHWDWYFTWKEPFYKSNQLQCNIKYYACTTSKISII